MKRRHLVQPFKKAKAKWSNTDGFSRATKEQITTRNKTFHKHMDEPIYNGGAPVITGPKEFTISFNVDLSWQCPMCGANGSEEMICPDCKQFYKKGLGLAGGIDRLLHPENYEE